MLKSIIYNLKDIGAEHLLLYKCQPYAEGVEFAWEIYNSMILRGSLNDIETKIKMKLAQAYADRENADNNAEEAFQAGMVDFYEYILEHD